MNLVAKEYIASQTTSNPGVLVLSRFTGAAEQLRDALLVNPYDERGVAEAMERALTMPLAERVDRHAALLENIRANDVHRWCVEFLTALGASLEIRRRARALRNRPPEDPAPQAPARPPR